MPRPEETGGDPAKTPIGLQGANDKREGEQVLIIIVRKGSMNGVLIDQGEPWHFRQLDRIGDEVFFTGNRINGDAFLLPGQDGNGKTEQKQEK